MANETMERMENVTLLCKANVYFGGKVVSHTVINGTRRHTVGVIYPGTYTFDTEAAERMEIIAGACRVKVAGEAEAKQFEAGSTFAVGAKSSFEIAVDSGLAEYVCSFE